MSVPHMDGNPYHPPSRANHSRFFHIRNLAAAAIVGIILIAVLLPFGYVSVFDGHFDLTVAIPSGDSLDPASLQYAPCWTIQQAQSAVAYGTQGTVPFYPGKAVTPKTYVLSIRCSGRSNAFGRITSYNHPRYLVIQYMLTGRPTEAVRKQLLIPQGRGDRSMDASIP